MKLINEKPPETGLNWQAVSI